MSRYLDAKSFRDEANKLKVASGYLSDSVLERLEQQRSLLPKLRLRYPDAIERRWWIEGHEDQVGQQGYSPAGKLEPDGNRWEAACALEEARQKWMYDTDPTKFVHPLDTPEPRFRQFMQRPKRRKFVPWRDFRVRVANGPDGPLYHSDTVVTYYSSWQLLLFSEVVNMGVMHFLNLEQSGWPPPPEALTGAPRSASFQPIYALRDFNQHEAALNAIVWFAEEAQRGFMFATRREHGRRMLDEAEREEVMRTRLWAAQEALRRHRIGFAHVLAATKFLCEQWAHWNHEGRSLIANAYKSFLAQAVRLACLSGKIDYSELGKQVGQAGGWFKPIFDVIWPDWAAEQRDDARRILVSFNREKALLSAPFTEVLVDRFLDFIEANNLHGFYWRLDSFNHHAFKGNDYATDGLRADVQGMAVVLEHVTAALGATKPQLRDKFKELWTSNPAVMKGLRDNAVMKVGNGTGIDLDWFEGRQALGPTEQTCADLAICYAIRGGAHRVIGEENPLKLERMMLILLRAAVKTFEAATSRVTIAAA